MERKEKDEAVREFTGAGAITGMLLVRPEGVKTTGGDGPHCRECGAEVKGMLFFVCTGCTRRHQDVWKLTHARDTRPMTAWELDDIVARDGRVRGAFVIDLGPRRGPHHRERPHPTATELDVLGPACGDGEEPWEPD